MRRSSAVFLCLCILLSLTTPAGQAQSGAWSLQVLEADERHVLLELTLPSFESEAITQEGTQYQRVWVTEWGSWGQAGQPQLPMVSVPLGMPWPGDPQISVIEAESETFEGYLLYPAPGVELESSEDVPQVAEVFTLDASTYRTDTFYPGQLAEAAASGFLRDQAMFQLRLYPFQYNPLRRELRVYRRLKVQVVFPEASPSLAEAGRAQPSPVFERILKRTLLNYDSLPRPAAASSPPSGGAPITVLDTQPQVKLHVEDSGLYRITYEELQPVAADLVAGDPRRLELSNQGVTVPILFDGEGDGTFDPGDSFLFYGQAIPSDYTRYNVYWLKAGSAPGLRIGQRNGAPGAGTTPAAFADSRHYEEDQIYWRDVPNGDGQDHWFWSGLAGGSSSPRSVQYTFDLHHIAASGPEGRLRLMLHAALSGTRLTQLYLNGHALLAPAEAWSGAVENLHEIAVPQNFFREGTNYLRVENTPPAGSTSDEIDLYVNWFEVTYQDTYVAESNRLLFSAPSPGSYTFKVTGFSTNSIQLFDITDPATPVRITDTALEPDGGGYRLRFSDNAAIGQKYLAQPGDQLPTPALELDETSAWKSATNGATYLIITHPSFYASLQMLAAYRRDQGETVVVVKTEDIYDEFNYGIYDPQAIRLFLEYAYANWSPQPTYVLLVGDASADPKNNLGWSLPDLLPAHYVDTPLFGQSPNDSWYAKVHGEDDYPDVIVGRIPARYTSDVTTVADKVQMYEESLPSGGWSRRAVLVADDGDSAFRRDMETIAGVLPESVTPIKIYNYVSGTSVQNEVGAGALLLAYSGHGASSGTSWGYWPGGHAIFTQSQMQNLWNGDKLPFMTVANCLSGLFDQYDRSRVMAEEFLLLHNKGGIASWAPASYGFPTTNSLILEELYQALLTDNDLILGSAATTARIEAHLRRPDLPLSLFEAFTYLGDPALRLYIPASLELSGQDSPDPVAMGEMLTYTLTYTVSGAAQAHSLTLVDVLPQHLKYQSASPAPSSINDQTLTWNLGDVPSGSDSIAVTAQVNISGLAHGQIVQNQARLYAADGGDQVVQIETTVHDSSIVASFISSTPDKLGQTTTFQSTSTGSNLSYEWDFGDGSHPLTTSTPIVTHTYTATGTYGVTLTASNSAGSSSVTHLVEMISVVIAPLASFTSSSPDELGQTTVFINTSQDGGDDPENITYQWAFGDGASSTDQHPMHTYNAPGTYMVSLMISNSVGSNACSDRVTINPGPEGQGPTRVYLPLIFKSSSP
jgi:uncharacterized repeat protein (TIGR01451 family)